MDGIFLYLLIPYCVGIVYYRRKKYGNASCLLPDYVGNLYSDVYCVLLVETEEGIIKVQKFT